MGHFYFTRHGQTVWNVENKICGATDIELTELGHEQAMELGRKIKEKGVKIDEILYSPLVRAKETARHISEVTGIPMREEMRLKEQNLENMSPLREMGRSSKRQNRTLSIILKAGRLCCICAREFIIFWMISGKRQMIRSIFL